MLEEEITNEILKSSFKVHSSLGPGLLESSYQACLAYELKKGGFCIEVEKPMPLEYENIKLDVGYRIDIIVESRVIVEIKSVDLLKDIHLAQVLTYLKLSRCKVGLLLNFNVTSLKNGIKRVVL